MAEQTLRVAPLAEPGHPPALTYEDYVWDGPSFRQRDLTPAVVYDRAYIDSRYAAIDSNVRALSAARLKVLEAFTAGRDRLLDFGCGTNRFVEVASVNGWQAVGYDVEPSVSEIYWHEATAKRWDVATFFDSLEHLPDPAGTIQSLAAPTIMVSVPECHRPNDPAWFMSWKHRRPGEHLWHWSRAGLTAFMRQLGYRELMASNFEDEFRPNPEQELPNILTGIYRRR